jgi:hypothetical protein
VLAASIIRAICGCLAMKQWQTLVASCSKSHTVSYKPTAMDIYITSCNKTLWSPNSQTKEDDREGGKLVMEGFCFIH